MDAFIQWLTQNLSDVPDGDDWLGEREQEHLSGLRFPKRRNDWRLGRWTAKRAYGLYHPEPPPSMPDIDIVAAEDGGPEVHFRHEPAPVSISISHSHGRGFCAIAPVDSAVGCDLERIEFKSPEFFEDYFRPEESLYCREAPGAIRSMAGYLIWSAKESCLKVLREGLRRDTRSVQVDVGFKGAKESWNAWTGHCVETARVFHGWWRYESGFVYTIAADRPNQTPRELHVESGPRSEV